MVAPNRMKPPEGRANVDRGGSFAYVSSMAQLDIITIPDPILRTRSKEIERVDAELLKLMDDMLETMYEAPGIGLAAVQIGLPIRAIVIDTARDEEPKDPIRMVNPEILSRGQDMRPHEEGCLSIPEFFAEIERPAQCRVRYVDHGGTVQEQDFEGILSTVIQHEVDHLNGVLFIDYLSRLKRDMVVKKFTKAKKGEMAI